MAVKADEKLEKIESPDLEEVVDTETVANTDDLKEYEGDILNALMDASNYKQDESERYLIRVVRNNTILLKFHIHPLSEEDYDKCRQKNTKYVRNRRIGTKLPESTNDVRYRSQVIFTATVKEDREKLWNNKEAWAQLNVASGVDLIDKVLKGGEKDKILEQIDKISGYDNSQLEETIKN